ncbi:MAG: NAD(P)H-quinone oxidoreductase [Gemmatimonadaceae bacterium]
MRAAVITRSGGPEVLEIQDVPTPTPSDGEVVVRVRGSALNRADLLQRQGRYPAPPGAPANIPGLEIAGEVHAVGPAVTRWSAGDRVFGIVAGGGNAEFVAVRERELAPIPASLSFEHAAAVPEAFITAHDALITQAAMQPGEAVLVHAIGSGVGLAATQLVRSFGGRCYGTARSADKIERARELGLTDGVVLDQGPEVILEYARRWTDGRGMNVILDLVGGPYLPIGVESAAVLGRIILIGLLAGRSATINLGTVLSRRVTVRGTVLRSRSPEEKAAATAAFVRDVLPLLESGAVRPVVDRVFPLHEIGAAHALLESNATFGKIVLLC